MIRINFYGDFYAPNTGILQMDEKLKDVIASADINVINLEAPSIDANKSSAGKMAVRNYVPIEKSGPSLSQSSESPCWLEANGFDIVSIANNHTMDYGEQGLLDTKEAFKKCSVTGGEDWQEAYTPCIVTVEGKRIAVFALSQCEFGNLTDEWDDTTTYGVAWINHPKVDTIIQKTRKEVDYLIVYAHAGLEQPLPEWRDRYRQFIDMGCDAVIASHPHIAQGWEFYHGHPIVYSLGNFYFPKRIADTYGWNKSLSASVLLEDGKINMEIIPLTFSEDKISLCVDKEYKDYIERVNRDLANRDVYMEYVNARCLEIEAKYLSRFVIGGIGSYTNWRDIKRYIGIRLRHPKKLSIAPLLNNIRCETHRWCFARAIKLKNHNIL